ncbi:hypothetical protein EJ08DRAFT_729601 [Tothia fuscella]|uniref:Uncharacterized protein n=1 Tax=Tothia fuscella TaxID=1048955 RepID=A0A9P4U3L3_9PEZI|nr:hypothetical protein EJ08DRAFT_729601 [Tothia fuscella]
MDEKGFLIGILQKTRRIFTKSTNLNGPNRGAGQDGSREWITFSGNIQDSWIHEVVPEDFYAYFTSSTSVKRPSTSTSKSSALSIFDPQNAYKLRQLIKRVNNNQPLRDVKVLTNAFVTLTTNNVYLAAKVEGLTKAVDIAKRRQIKGKPVLPTVLLQANKGKAQFWSPTKLKDEERFTNAKKTAQEQEKVRKAEEKRNKQRKKEDLAIIVAQRKSNKERDRRAKKQAIEEAKTQKEVDKQLKIDLKLATPKPKS